MSVIDQLVEEMEVLESMYGDEFVKTKEGTYYVTLITEHITVYINVKNTKELIPCIHLSDKVVKDIIPEGVTESLTRGIEWNQFKDTEVVEIMQIVNDQIYPESVVVFSVVSAVQEQVETLFEHKYKERHAKPTMELSDAQMQGTKVTKEVFQNWWSTFRVKVAVVPQKRSKLTGKQLFEQGSVAVSDEPEEEDAIDVDYSLFANE